jgi:hypothetical protein
MLVRLIIWVETYKGGKEEFCAGKGHEVVGLNMWQCHRIRESVVCATICSLLVDQQNDYQIDLRLIALERQDSL